MGLTFSNRFGKLLKPVLHIELGGASTIKSFRKQKSKKKKKGNHTDLEDGKGKRSTSFLTEYIHSNWLMVPAARDVDCSLMVWAERIAVMFHQVTESFCNTSQSD